MKTIRWRDSSLEKKLFEDVRTLIYETEDNGMKIIQNGALYVLAFNCGIIAYWLREFKPIFNDFLTNHGAKNANGQRIGQPRTQISIFGLDKNIGLNRFIILVNFLSKILVPFVDSITGKINQQIYGTVLGAKTLARERQKLSDRKKWLCSLCSAHSN